MEDLDLFCSFFHSRATFYFKTREASVYFSPGSPGEFKHMDMEKTSWVPVFPIYVSSGKSLNLFTS